MQVEDMTELTDGGLEVRMRLSLEEVQLLLAYALQSIITKAAEESLDAYSTY